MTMSPEEFRERYATAVADEPPRPSVEHDVAVARGRHLLRRRRIAAGASACLAVVAIVGGAAFVRGAEHDDGSAPALLPSPKSEWMSDAQLFDECRRGERTRRVDAARMYSAGPPIVKASSFGPEGGSAMLESADGRYWGWCRITPSYPERTGMAALSSSIPRGRESHYFSGPGCAVGEGDLAAGDCRQFMMSWAGRLPLEVATMVFVMGNGEHVRLAGNDGYFVLEYLGELPRGVWLRQDGQLPFSFEPYRSIKYLDANGNDLTRHPGDGPWIAIPHPAVFVYPDDESSK
jgi:hypothetical protein